jgi:hypothetical protein
MSDYGFGGCDGHHEQLSGPLKDFVVDFKNPWKDGSRTGPSGKPSQIPGNASKLAALVAALRPEPDGYAKANSMQDIGRKLLQSVGADRGGAPAVASLGQMLGKPIIPVMGGIQGFGREVESTAELAPTLV